MYNVGQKESDNIFAYWEHEKAGFLCISYSLPGYDIQAPEDMRHMFCDIPGLSYLDVTNLNVSKTIDFTGCFAKFGENKDSHIFGLEKWNIQNGKYFGLMFYKAFPNNDEVALIAPSFKTTPLMEASLRECFSNFAPRAEKVILDVIDWNIERNCDLTSCFDSFALQATNVVISGPELWKINGINNFSFMFDNFAPISNCCLDLSRWKTSSKSIHMGFAINTFFKIREPKWE